MKYAVKLVTISLLLGAIRVVAMPSEAEIAKTESLIKELVSDEFAAMKNGKKTRPEVAEACLNYVEEADGEAAKVLLIRMAFDQYMAGGAFDKAAETFGKLGESVKDIPDGLLGRWATPYLPKICKTGCADGLAILINRAIAENDLDSANALAKPVKSSRSRLAKSKAWPQLQTALNEIIRLKARGKELVGDQGETQDESERSRASRATGRFARWIGGLEVGSQGVRAGIWQGRRGCRLGE